MINLSINQYIKSIGVCDVATMRVWDMWTDVDKRMRMNNNKKIEIKYINEKQNTYTKYWSLCWLCLLSLQEDLQGETPTIERSLREKIPLWEYNFSPSVLLSFINLHNYRCVLYIVFDLLHLLFLCPFYYITFLLFIILYVLCYTCLFCFLYLLFTYFSFTSFPSTR